MQMKSQLSRILAIAAIGVFSVCASAAPASAQVAFKGAFTLPNDVRWQGKNLPAGDYTFTLKSVALPAQLTVTGANGDSMFIVTAATNGRMPGEKSYLTVEHHGAASFIRDLYLAGLELDLRYSVPKTSKDEQRIAQGPVTTERILIASNEYSHK
jgi:hypothetical protein